MPEVVNILLSHNPNTFDRAAELGIDLTLAGHTHGGEFEFIPSRRLPHSNRNSLHQRMVRETPAGSSTSTAA